LGVTAGLPGSATPVFGTNPQTTTGAPIVSTFKVTTTAATLPGTYTFQITGTNGPGCQGTGPTPSPLVTLKVVGPATHFSVTGFASGTTPDASTFTVTALDASNNTATGFTGTATFTSTDAQATLPANYTFVSGDAGV